MAGGSSRSVQKILRASGGGFLTIKAYKVSRRRRVGRFFFVLLCVLCGLRVFFGFGNTADSVGDLSRREFAVVRGQHNLSHFMAAIVPPLQYCQLFRELRRGACPRGGECFPSCSQPGLLSMR